MVDTENPAFANQTNNADQLEQSIEEWRTSALRTIDARIALYDPKPIGQDAPPATSSASPHAHYSGSHRALDVVEILEHILSYASPRTHFAAWNVSRHWREIVVHTLGTQYRVPYPCAAVEYGDTIPPSLKWLPPSEDGVTRLQNTCNIRNPYAYRRILSDHFLTARFTQAYTLPQELLTSLHTKIRSEYGRFGSSSIYSLAEEPRWLDLSQLEVNPYFVDLFGDCFQPFQGNYTITIKPRIHDYLKDLSSSKIGPSREQLIHSMFLSRPPCKVLRIRAIGKIHEEMQVLGIVSKEDGVRVGDLLLLLQQHFSTATELWQARSRSLREEVSGHTTPFRMLEAWNCPGFPKLAIFLEGMAQSDRPLAHHLCTIFQRNRYMHKTEWHEDHTKPTRIFVGNPELKDPEEYGAMSNLRLDPDRVLILRRP